MHRRSFLRTMSAAGIAAAAANPLPNVVIIYADDLGYGDLSVYNKQSKIPTPNLDRLASQGIRFTNAHAPDTICAPSRYGLLTGRYAWRTGNKSGNWPEGAPPWIESGRPTIASMLKGLGYDTAAIGKWGIGADWSNAARPGRRGDDISEAGIDHSKPIRVGATIGFTYDIVHLWYGRELGAKDYGKFKDGGRWYFENGLAEGGKLDLAAFDMREAQMRFARRVVEYIDAKGRRAANPAFHQNKAAPFFVYYAPHIPHLPVVPARQFQGKTQAGDYGDFVCELDWAVGEILSALERNGFLDNTLVLFSSDNGPEVQAYERMKEYGHASMGSWRGVKRDLWEGGHRVPFIASWPARFQRGVVSDALTCQTDVMATVAEIAGAPLPNQAAEDSFSFLHDLAGRPPRGPVRESIVYHSANNKLGIRRGNWVLMADGNGSGNARAEPAWFRKERGIEPTETPNELFDLVGDPGQTTNLYGGNPQKAKELKALLDRYIRSGRSAPER